MSANPVPSMVAMMGGTFDPVHHGHLRTALELRDRLQPDRLHLVPCHIPAHRGIPSASSSQRLRMVELAIDGEAGLIADDRELRAQGPSYSVATLTALRAEVGPECALVMVIGTDALLGLASWHRWQELQQLAHIVVVRRPGWELSDEHPLAAWVAEHLVTDADALRRQPAGCLMWQEITPLEISATQVRAAIAAGSSPRYLIPDPVWNYIREQGLYLTSQD